MKTQVIQLQEHDDVISIRDYMAWIKTPRILLVWPLEGRVHLSAVDLTLLRRHAKSLGKELGLVTHDADIIAIAHDLKISVFPRTVEAQKKQWLERQSVHQPRRSPRLNIRADRKNLPSADIFAFAANPLWRVLIFMIGLLAVFATFLIFVPTAQVQITLPEQVQGLTIAVSSEPNIQDVEISGLVPQHTMTLTLDGKDTALATGSAIMPGAKASGEALLMNLTDKPVSIPSGTVFMTHSTPPVSFITLETGAVPAGKGKTANVSLQAATAGLSGNVGSSDITMIAGDLGSQLAVNNIDPTAGGTQSNIVLATDQDRENLRRRMLADLQQQAFARFSSQLPAGDVLFIGTLTQPRVMQETFSPEAGVAGQKLTLNLRVEYGIAFASSSDLHMLAENVLDASLPAGFLPVSNQVDLQPVSGFTEGQGIVHWQLHAERKIRAQINKGQILSLVQGKTPENATSKLKESLGLTDTPAVSVSPDWWPWLPFLPVQISIKG